MTMGAYFQENHIKGFASYDRDFPHPQHHIPGPALGGSDFFYELQIDIVS